MRYRRLGRTEFLVSEVGLDAGRLAGVDEATGEETLRGAFAAGITLVVFPASDATTDVEPLVARVAGSDRPRLTLIAALDVLPPPPEVGPQVEAVAARLGSEGYLDAVVFPVTPTPAHLEALSVVRLRGAVRAWGVAAATEGAARVAAEAGAEVLLLLAADLVPQGVGAGVVLVADLRGVRAALEVPGVGSVVASLVTPEEVDTLARASSES